MANYRPNVRSRHPSHAPIKQEGALPKFPNRVVVRLGSTTSLEEIYRGRNPKVNLQSVIEVNKVEGVLNSSSKIQMKRCFNRDGVKTADWFMMRTGSAERVNNMQNGNDMSVNDLPYPIIAKKTNGSRGEGMEKLDNVEQMKTFLRRHSNAPNSYILEKFYNFGREFRLHVTKEGCFYTCRKALKRDVPANQRWYMNDTNCVWLKDTNANFNRPTVWNNMEKEAVKALKAVGLDIGAVDVKVQKETRGAGARRRETVEFIILETNSAPSFGTVTEQKYRTTIPQIITAKINSRGQL